MLKALMYKGFTQNHSFTLDINTTLSTCLVAVMLNTIEPGTPLVAQKSKQSDSI